jgi:hypothetical protein
MMTSRELAALDTTWSSTPSMRIPNTTGPHGTLLTKDETKKPLCALPLKCLPII